MYTNSINRESDFFNDYKMFLVKLFSAFTSLKMWTGVVLLSVFSYSGAYKWLEAHAAPVFEQIGYMKWLVFAMAIDLVTGVMKARVKKVSVTSYGLRRTVRKVIEYVSFLGVTYIVTHFENAAGQVANQGLSALDKIAFEFLLAIEIKSTYENLVEMDPKLDFMKTVMEKVGGFFNKK